MTIPDANSHRSHGPVANEGPGKAPGSPAGAGNAHPGCRRPATSSANAWRSWLVLLLFGAGLAAFGLALGRVTWRLGQLAGRARPAEERLAEVRPAARPQQEKWTPDPDQGEEAAAILALPEVPLADLAFEQRLHASEEDLLALLRAIPEVRLMSDGDVRSLRGDQQAAKERKERLLMGSARARLDGASSRVNSANAQLAAVSPYGGYSPWLVSARQEAVRDYLEANSALQQATSKLTQERERIGYDSSLRLHETLKQAAAQAGLSLQSGPTCQLAPSTAAQVAKLAKDLRDGGFVSGPGVRPVKPSGSASDEAARESMKTFAAWCDQHQLEGKSGTVPTLTQLLQVEDEAKRLLLVRELTRIVGEAATTQLAVRAVADLSPAVRRAAVAGLEQRPWQQYGPVLLRGLRYPWSPAADHAAVALRALKPREAVAPLVDLLDLPSPSAPFLDPETKQYTVRELVRLNHLRNCLLCHAPSANTEDGLVRGLVPTPGEALPVEYYGAPAGDFVRADTTFVRQDFSVYLPNAEVDPWPREQRYDFVTRLRPLPPGQGTALPGSSSDYPQRGAVLYALRGLTGMDGGGSSARWRELLGPITGKPKRQQERPALDKITVSRPDPDRPR
jgi:hypothetical protein